jgi:hypothetical protein
MNIHRSISFVCAALLIVTTGGCQGVYFNALERVGFHKRDILVDRVEDARDSQEEAKEQFASALERFMSVVAVEGGSLEDKYKQLDAELQRSEQRANDVRKRIDAVEDVAGALFAEWEQELREYNDANLRRKSEAQLRDTRARYRQLLSAMKRAEASIEPVLVPLRDQVLYLKHNLNARAIASLQTELNTVEADVAELVREMENAINEANAFISAMELE